VRDTHSGLIDEESEKIWLLLPYLFRRHAKEVIKIFSIAIRAGLKAKDLNDSDLNI